MEFDLKVIIAIVVVSAFLVAKLLEPSKKYSSLPPGPKVLHVPAAQKLLLIRKQPHRIFGNHIPKPYTWQTFEKWTRQYGDLCTVWQGRSPMVKSNSRMKQVSC